MAETSCKYDYGSNLPGAGACVGCHSGNGIVGLDQGWTDSMLHVCLQAEALREHALRVMQSDSRLRSRLGGSISTAPGG